MTLAPATPAAAATGRRLIVFRSVAGLAALLILPSAVSLLAPWSDVNVVGFSHPERARWSMALEGSVDLLLVVCLVVSAVRVQRARTSIQLVAVTAVVAAIVVTPFAGPSFLINLALLTAVVAAYPFPAELIARPTAADVVRPLLAITVPAAGVLVPVAVAALRDQMAMNGGHDPDLNVLATDAEHLLVLGVAGVLAGLGAPGWRLVGTAVGAVWAYVGLASIVLPDQPHSWGPGAGGAAMAVGVAIVAATWVSRQPSSQT